MALNRDQLQLIDWYLQGYHQIAIGHGLSVEIMAEWLQDRGYYESERGSELADRMLRELRAKTSNYEIYYLGSIQLAV
ncbi:hypothetical protein DKP74_06250 [Fructilactobacillus sanfranciscensis]|uniref:hypothetical protein n=1 Tax=Fructilactobacillus sanfranciscensis TaxID=1625 RepID=UPI0011185DF7|nr:hypothetical protein [Fructilactobacillus sanfranciscensis]TNK95117.1 hypothetical protein DKP74_06250 [Fructilactobacillus sanfranciscensis]